MPRYMTYEDALEYARSIRELYGPNAEIFSTDLNNNMAICSHKHDSNPTGWTTNTSSTYGSTTYKLYYNTGSAGGSGTVTAVTDNILQSGTTMTTAGTLYITNSHNQTYSSRVTLKADPKELGQNIQKVISGSNPDLVDGLTKEECYSRYVKTMNMQESDAWLFRIYKGVNGKRYIGVKENLIDKRLELALDTYCDNSLNENQFEVAQKVWSEKVTAKARENTSKEKNRIVVDNSIPGEYDE